MVKPGRYREIVNHLSTLRTLEEMFDLKATGAAANVPAIADCWK
jgi:hypothetical protein